MSRSILLQLARDSIVEVFQAQRTIKELLFANLGYHFGWNIVNNSNKGASSTDLARDYYFRLHNQKGD